VWVSDLKQLLKTKSKNTSSIITKTKNALFVDKKEKESVKKIILSISDYNTTKGKTEQKYTIAFPKNITEYEESLKPNKTDKPLP
jgi:hypothetical protein